MYLTVSIERVTRKENGNNFELVLANWLVSMRALYSKQTECI